MYACGIKGVQLDDSQEHFVLPEVPARFRSRFDGTLMEELLAIQAATAMEAGLTKPAHMVVDTFPSMQGNPRVNEAATLYKAPKSIQLIVSIVAQCTTRGTVLQAIARIATSPRPVINALAGNVTFNDAYRVSVRR